MFKSGFVAVLGRPNVGKSSLVNAFLNQKVVIVSNKPQTTRKSINAILTRDDCQIIFIDTPGIHNPKDSLGEYMVKKAKEAKNDVDLILFITTPEVKMLEADKKILSGFNKDIPVFLCVNKVDENDKARVLESLKNYSLEYDFKEIIPISALKLKNTDKLLELILENLKEGPKYYPDDMVIDREERFLICELIREKALKLLSEEVPHGIAVEIVSMVNEDNIAKIEASLICEKDSHKGIIIGKNGGMLKKISTFAREDIEQLLNKKVYIKIWVKVRDDWRNKNNFLKEYGYK